MCKHIIYKEDDMVKVENYFLEKLMMKLNTLNRELIKLN